MAVTHAELRVPALGEAPAALQVLIKAVDGVDLVTALCAAYAEVGADEILVTRSEEHTSELQSLMRISYAVFCLKNNKTHNKLDITNNTTYRQILHISTH